MVGNYPASCGSCRIEMAWRTFMGIDSQYRFYSRYTLEEREKLVDVYMAKFKEIYGKYPKSVGSWYVDSHTLVYV